MIVAKTDQEKAVLNEIKRVEDPDLGLSLYELGLIYAIDVSGSVAKIKMTLTSMACPAANRLKDEIHAAAVNADGIENAEVEIVWVPKWDPKTMASEDARFHLGIF